MESGTRPGVALDQCIDQPLHKALARLNIARRLLTGAQRGDVGDGRQGAVAHIIIVSIEIDDMAGQRGVVDEAIKGQQRGAYNLRVARPMLPVPVCQAGIVVLHVEFPGDALRL